MHADARTTLRIEPPTHPRKPDSIGPVLVRRATSTEARALAYRLRFQVFCVERPILPAPLYLEGVETDLLDSQSEVFLATDALGPVGTVRAIRNRPQPLPVLALCAASGAVDPDRTIEVSRLAVLRRGRSRDVLTHFTWALAAFAEVEGVEHWGARMLSSGLLLLQRLGLPVRPAPGRTEPLEDGTELVPILAPVAETRAALSALAPSHRLSGAVTGGAA